ncbi:serine hydrolase [Streptomyces sp. PAN_FS17]|uniref:serine hydrolase n=1 Tax=Streptomyces sp. PAN_FS17 TaxID=1855351 RepID=UPI000897071F|nr:serine hydrolase [Streptomyces sp. PAN_FS17]SEB84327.1 Beta-lactamase class A [Streptomyces sp. PAN_FS17]
MPDTPMWTHLNRGLRASTLRVCAAGVAAAAVAASLAACSPAGPPSPAQAASVHAAPPAPGPPREKQGRDATLAQALKPLLPGGTTRLAVAVVDLDSADEEVASYRANEPFDTASISKLGILAALLLKAQDEDRALTASEREDAEAMIRTSDNHAANTLWQTIGEADGLDTAHHRLGLKATKGGPGTSWGLTQTTAHDQIQLLRTIFAPGPMTSRPPKGLAPASRAYIRRLMSQITDDQDWGISAARSPGSRWALKNGWNQRTTTGLWIINSVGHITVHSHHYLISVLSSGTPTLKPGITLIERTARAAIGTATTHTHPWPPEP